MAQAAARGAGVGGTAQRTPSNQSLKTQAFSQRTSTSTGATCSFTTDRIPDWPEVHTRWKMEGVVVWGGDRTEQE